MFNPPEMQSSSSHQVTPISASYQKSRRAARPSLVRQEGQKKLDVNDIVYDWHIYSPDDNSCWHFFRWLIIGGSAFAKQTDEELLENLGKLARCLTLLRTYESTYGMPEDGGPQDQEFVLRNVMRDLYAGGAPIWALEEVMQKAAEGLTGQKGVNWFLLPRKAFIFAPSSGATSMFKIERGFNIKKLEDMERVAVFLASLASNTRGASNIPSRFPKPEELQRASNLSSERYGNNNGEETDFSQILDKEELATEILSLASEAEGLIFFLNSAEYKESTAKMEDDFWIVSDTERELFSRLAALEAIRMMDSIDANAKVLYSPALLVLFRFVTAAGACAFWFSGSWQDMIVSGVLAVCVGFFGQSSFLSKQERIVFEVVASFVVGVTAGLIAIKWQNDTCFAAMALAGVLDILQGFRVVYAIIEIMSKHTVCGGADLLEGILFTGLIAYFLRFGQNLAARLMGEEEATVFLQCTHGINELWYILLVPLTALSWSGSFTPAYADLPLMCFHGCLAYGVNYGLSQARLSDNLNNFVSALCVSLSAGLFSRFSGKSAVGNTVSGLYVLLPGAYLVRSLFSSTLDGSFFSDIIQRAIIIGLGAWTGTILCSPTLIGATRGLVSQQSEHGGSRRRGSIRVNPMLFF